MNSKNKKQDRMVAVYWTKAYVKELDEVAIRLSMRRNEFIKEAVREKLEKEKKKLALC